MSEMAGKNGATARVASFICGAALEALPPSAVPKAKKAIADTFAAILSGAGSELSQPLLSYVTAMQASGEHPLLGTGVSAVPETAALVNGAFGHALDYDDVLSMMPAHPSAVILAA
ncbi:MAG TPA: MmgE/PrpD family protein, partial [Burkholderiales bacterium]|nr:MmgE/PrpD family protein [Burkholderiales bacterium]